MDTSKFAQSELAVVLMAVQTAVILIEKNTREIAFVNTRAAEIVGLNPTEMIGRKCHRFICARPECECPVCDLGMTIVDEPSFILRADGSRCPIIKSVKIIEVDGTEYLLETYKDATKIERATEELYWRFRKHNELQKQLLMPGSLSDKLDLICRTVTNITELETVEIWVNGRVIPFCENPRQSLESSLVLCSRSGKGQRSFAGVITSLFEKTDRRIEYQNSSGEANITALVLEDGGDKRLGVLAVYSPEPLTREISDFSENIAETATQVMINSLSEYRLKEALEMTEKANRLMEGREFRIRDIKKEMNELTSGLGWGKVYKDLEEEDFDAGIDLSNMIELRKNALSLAEDAEIERQKAVEAHRQLVLIKHAVNSSNDSIVITLANGDIYYTNETFDDLFGYSAASIMMSRQEELFVDRELFLGIRKLIEKGESWSGNVEVRKSNGSVFPVMLRVSTIRDEESILLGSIWHYIDITRQIEDRKRIEQDLKEKKELLRKAQILQKSYIQKTIPLIDSFNVEALFFPCEDLGGDFFRILKGMREDKLVIIMGDCTDHGIRSSMDASLLLSLTDPLLHHLYDSSRTDLFLAEVARQFSLTADDDQFPTMFVMVIDCLGGLVHYSSANSTNPLILRDGQVSELPRAEGLHIGYEEDPVYMRKSFKLEEGDRFLLFSDALTESMKGGLLHFDINHIKNLFMHREKSSGHLFDFMVNNLMAGRENFNRADDTTLILLEYRKPHSIILEFSDLVQWRRELDVLKEILTRYDYTDREIAPASIAIDEMCINAFTHGNKGDSALTVKVEGTISCSSLWIRITDQGEGFDYRNIPEPADVLEMLIEEDCEEEYTHGRGIWISRNYMDKVVYSQSGNSVEMLYRKKQRPVLISD